MKVSVIIPFREKHRLVDKCVESAKNQSYRNLEVITVSNKEKYKKKSVRSFFNPRRKGVGVKRNLGAENARGHIFLFLDSDCILKRNAVANLVNVFKKTNADAVSGKTLAPRLKPNTLSYVTGLEYEDRFDQMGENFVDTAATTCLGVTKNAFKKIGGFKDYTTGEATGEDWDFTAKMTKKGLKIFHTNKVQVYHEHYDTFKKYLKRQYQHARYRVTHYRKYKQARDQYSSGDMLLSSIILLNIPCALRLYRRTKSFKVFISLIPISFFRSFAWISGMILGVIRD
ncbi:MAG: glycosyltransferase [Candidatus Hodarchaeales archaeon]|jgi:glycosyltransferase involved in cell wall biosynthesis